MGNSVDCCNLVIEQQDYMTYLTFDKKNNNRQITLLETTKALNKTKTY